VSMGCTIYDVGYSKEKDEEKGKKPMTRFPLELTEISFPASNHGTILKYHTPLEMKGF